MGNNNCLVPNKACGQTPPREVGTIPSQKKKKKKTCRCRADRAAREVRHLRRKKNKTYTRGLAHSHGQLVNIQLLPERVSQRQAGDAEPTPLDLPLFFPPHGTRERTLFTPTCRIVCAAASRSSEHAMSITTLISSSQLGENPCPSLVSCLVRSQGSEEEREKKKVVNQESKKKKKIIPLPITPRSPAGSRTDARFLPAGWWWRERLRGVSIP